MDERTHSLRLWHYEWRKLFGGALPVLIALLLLLLGVRGAYLELVLPRTFEENLTKDYMAVLEGEVTEEKRQYIQDLKQQINDIQSQYDPMTKGYASGNVSYEEYTAYLTAYRDAANKKDIVEKLQERLWRIDMLAAEGKRADFVFEAGWERILSCEADYCLSVFLILMLSGIYAYEKRCGFCMILHTTKNGRWKTARTKLCITLLLSIGTATLSFLYRIILVATSIELSAFSSPAASIAPYESFGGTLLQLLLLNGALRICGAVMLGLLCFSLSALFEKTLPVIVLMSLSVLTVPLLHVFDVTVMDELMLNGMLGGMSPILSATGLLSAMLWSSATLLLTMISFWKMKGA